MKLRNIITIILVIQGQLMFAQDTLRLKDAIVKALEKNYSISIAENATQIAEINNSPGNAGMLPRLDLNGARSISINNSHAEYFDGRVRDVNDAKTNNQSAGIQLAWTVFDGMNMFIQRDKLNELEALSNIQLRGVVEDLVSQVSRIYFEIVAQKKLLDLYHETLQISVQRKTFTKARFDLGKESQLSYLQATVDMNADSANYMKQLAAFTNSISSLNVLLMNELNTEVVVGQDIPINDTLTFNSLWVKVQEQSPELQQARSEINLANLSIKEVKTARLPRVNITSGYSYSKSETDVGVFTSNQNIGFSAGVTLSYNIFNGMTNNQKLKVAKIREESAIQDAELLKLNIEANLQQVFTDFKTNQKLVNFENENMKFARLNWDIAKEKYRLGAMNDIELRETQEKLVDAESRLLQALYRCKIAEIELLHISGQLSDVVALSN
jgi:outer membrane protein TolC